MSVTWLAVMINCVITLSEFTGEALACGSWFHSHFENVMTQFIINKRTDTKNIVVNMLIIFSVDGDWSDWTEWTLCSQVCNGGEQTRFRECNNPAPLHGGKDCQGNKRESRTCNFFKCPGETMVETLEKYFVLARLR